MSKIKNNTSLEWMIVKDHCLERLVELHELNESPLDPVDTAETRGKIYFLREILSLEIEDTKIETGTTQYID